MELVQAIVGNFGSFKNLTIDYKNNLSLIYGMTGSGKSTILDIPSWILFGTTAKGGKADEIINWNEDNTYGMLTIKKGNDLITVWRSRGKNKNDLYFGVNDTFENTRGKDLTDTQRILNERLGVDDYSYLLSCYYNEFSPTTLFFLSNANNRRELFESLVDLDVPVGLMKSSKLAMDEELNEIHKIQNRLSELKQILDYKNKDVKTAEHYHKKWEKDQEQRINNFELNKKETIDFYTNAVSKEKKQRQAILNTLESSIKNITEDLNHITGETCSTCNQPIEKFYRLKEELYYAKSEYEKHSVRPIKYESELQEAQNSIAPERQANPYLITIQTSTDEINKINDEIVDNYKLLTEYEKNTIQLEHLQKIINNLRGILLENAIDFIKTETNGYLEEFFDAELRVDFIVCDKDKLDALIYRNGNECSYKQLSKGQKKLLNLCFSIAVMQAAQNKSGVSLNNLFFDEALDGLDSNLKLKAYNLFASLHELGNSVTVVDHAPELQNMFEHKYKVELQRDESLLIYE